MSEQWRVGDRVRLTGRGWIATDSSDKYRLGTEHIVTGAFKNGEVQLEGDEYYWSLLDGWEIELVERAEEKTMSNDISEVNVGDRVKLTRENGDEATFTVAVKQGSLMDSKHNTYRVNAGDTLEILEKKFELVPGLYFKPHSSEQFLVTPTREHHYFSPMYGWIKSVASEEENAKVIRKWTRHITF